MFHQDEDDVDSITYDDTVEEEDVTAEDELDERVTSDASGSSDLLPSVNHVSHQQYSPST